VAETFESQCDCLIGWKQRSLVYDAAQKIQRIFTKFLDPILFAKDVQLDCVLVVGVVFSWAGETLHELRIVQFVVLGKALVVEPMDEVLEDLWVLFFQLDRLLSSFCETTGKSCAEEIGVMNKDGFMNYETLQFATNEDSRELRITCAVETISRTRYAAGCTYDMSGCERAAF
jgi:hypothetical protein